MYKSCSSVCTSARLFFFGSIVQIEYIYRHGRRESFGRYMTSAPIKHPVLFLWDVYWSSRLYQQPWKVHTKAIMLSIDVDFDFRSTFVSSIHTPNILALCSRPVAMLPGFCIYLWSYRIGARCFTFLIQKCGRGSELAGSSTSGCTRKLSSGKKYKGLSFV